MSEKYEDIKKFYDSKLWDINRVYNAVGRWITESEYELITGHNYEAKT